MANKLQRELKQSKPFRSIREEVILNLARTAEHFAAEAAELFKSFGLTSTQYNVLRILRGAGSDGLSCGEIGDRMITKESDVTRLLDRMEGRGLIARERPPSNRRVVITRITREGLQLVDELDGPVQANQDRLLSHIPEETLRIANDVLEAMREH
jgi:MarR family transcriptional regulator, organic hydroperoxide resistance regulator